MTERPASVPGASPAARRIDSHVHLVGDGSSGSGCWVGMASPHRRLISHVMLLEAGVPPRVLGRDLDACFERRLVEQVRESDLDAAVLLAQDLPHTDRGEPLPGKAGFYVPNDHLLTVCERHPGLFIPAVSIHPARPDALDELDRCNARGARVVKLLPNCLGIDYADRRYHPFWEKMAAAGLLLLSHTGGEMTLPVIEPRYADPRLLATPLDCGVTVIAAHAAGRSGLWDPDYTHDLIALFARYPRLYADNSALSSLNRSHTIAKVLRADVLERIVHGSDFPVPVGGFGPWHRGHIDWRTWQESRRDRHPLQRDLRLKRAMGFPPACETRLDGLLAR